MRTFRLIVAALILGVAAPSGNAQSVTDRGKMLYELRCGDCHNSSLHQRSRPVARNYEDVRAWVRHWSGVEGMGWEKQDVDAVTQYLNERFYKYLCPGDTC